MSEEKGSLIFDAPIIYGKVKKSGPRANLALRNGKHENRAAAFPSMIHKRTPSLLHHTHLRLQTCYTVLLLLEEPNNRYYARGGGERKVKTARPLMKKGFFKEAVSPTGSSSNSIGSSSPTLLCLGIDNSSAKKEREGVVRSKATNKGRSKGTCLVMTQKGVCLWSE